MIWPFVRKRKMERAPLLSEIAAQAEAEKAKAISAQALLRTTERTPEVREITARQLELRESNHWGEMFTESMRRKAD